MPADRPDRRRLARVRRGRPGRAALRLPGARAVGPRARPPLQPRQAARRPLRPRTVGALRLDPAVLGPALGDDDTEPDPHDSARVRAALGGRRPGVRLAGRPAARRPVGRTRWSTSCTSRASPRRTRASPRSSAGRTPGWRTRRRSSTSSGSASRPSSCCRCTTSSASRRCCGAGPANYWGYNTMGFFAPHAGYSAPGRARRAGRRVPRPGAGAARRRHRGAPRRRLQPHRRGRRRRPGAVLARPGQRGLLPARSAAAATPT